MRNHLQHKKAFIWIIISVALLIFVTIIYNWWDNQNYFEAGENGNFNIYVGDIIEIQLSENGSTGYQNCWINQHSCNCVQFVNREYKSSFQSKIGYVGSGGRVMLQFEGIRKGTDTIIIASCPTGREGKNCDDFSIDSIKPNNSFIVNVR